MVYDSSSISIDQGVVWDFRQFYVDWIKEYMIGFSIAHRSNNYPEMFDALKKWHSVIWGRTIKEFKVDGNEDETFGQIIDKITHVCNDSRFINTYLLKERNPQAVLVLEEVLNSAVVYLIWLMKKNKLFGSDSINRGLA